MALTTITSTCRLGMFMYMYVTCTSTGVRREGGRVGRKVERAYSYIFVVYNQF